MSNRTYAHLHDEKLEALEDLVEELSGQPLLVAYQFNHDRERLQKKFPHAKILGSGMTAAETSAIVGEWNRGEIQILLAHPASAGHGLNLQGSGAGHICWFGPIWNLELYDQFIKRVHRQGSTAKRVVNHMIVARGTIDELIVDALASKATTQNKLLAALNTEMLGTTSATEEPVATLRMENNMQPMRLSRQAPAGAPTPNVAPAAAITPRGWGAPANAVQNAPQSQPQASPVMRSAPHPAEVIEQQQRIEQKIAPQPVQQQEALFEEGPAPVNGRAAFSPALQQQMEGAAPVEPQPAEAAPEAGRKRTRQASITTPANQPDMTELRRWAVEHAIPWAREAGGDVFEIAQALVDFVSGKQ